MSNFLTLVGFEYKKIFIRKGTFISLVLGFVFIALYSTYFYMNEDIETEIHYAQELNGRALEADLILEAAEGYKQIDISVTNYQNSDVYKTYALPYTNVLTSIQKVYTSAFGDSFGIKEMQEITKEQAEDFYALRKSVVFDYIDALDISAATEAKLISMENSIAEPFIMKNYKGYQIFTSNIYMTGMVALFIVAFLISPIFANEYSTGADGLILASKKGKNILILAKLFTVFTVTFMITILLILLTVILCGTLYGFDATHEAIQIMMPITPLNISFGQMLLTVCICGLLGSLFFAAIATFISSISKNSFIVMTLLSLNIFGGMFNFSTMPGRLSNYANIIFPLKGFNLESLLICEFFEVFGQSIEIYYFLPILFLAGIIILSILFYHAFKNHQVS